jgi:hypothetical protein
MASTTTKNKNKWLKVVFAADCIYDDEDVEHEFAVCPNCNIDYTDCPCPGPTMDDEYDYKEVKGVMYARKKDSE